MVHRVSDFGLPASLQQFALTTLFNSQIKFSGTAGIWIEQWTKDESIMHLKNRRRVQNHIGGIHACGMALLAESATGSVFGMHVPDTHIPLIKSMKIEYKRRAQGDLKAVASLTPEQVESIQTTDKGEVNVMVNVTDENDASPIACEMIWAWVPKKRDAKPKSS